MDLTNNLQVILTADTAELTAAMSEASASVDAFAGQTDEASAAASAGLDDVGTSAGEASGGIDLLGGSLLKAIPELAAILGLYEGGRAFISNFVSNVEQHQAAESSLSTTIKTTGDAVGLTVDQLNKLAEANSKNSTVSQNANLQAEAVLLNYNELGKNVFPQAAASVDDLATKLAHGLPPSLQQTEQAAKLLGKALEDPATGMTALTRVGVTFSAQQVEQAKAMMKNNDLVGAQKLLLTDVSDVVSGQAAAAQDTFAGKLAVTKNAMENLEIGLSNTAGKDLPKLADAMNHAVDVAGKLLAPAFQILKEALAQLTQVYEAHKEQIDIVVKALGYLVAVILGGLVLAIGAAIVVLAQIIRLIADLITWVSDAITIIGNLGATIIRVFTSLWDDAKAGFDNFGNNIRNWANNVINDIVNFFKQLPSKIGDAVGSGAKDVTGVAGSIVKNLGGLFKASGGPVAGGQGYIVGEQGPEAFVPWASGKIVPNNQLNTSNTNINVYTGDVHGIGDVQSIGQTLNQQLRVASRGF